MVFSLFPPLRGRAKRDGLLVGSAALEIALLLKLGAVMLLGVVSYKLLSHELPVRLIGWANAAAMFDVWRARNMRGALQVFAFCRRCPAPQ